MIFKFFNKNPLLLLLCAVVCFSSCVNNSDEPDVEPERQPLGLTIDNLKGTWEIFYFTKEIIDADTGDYSGVYRDTDSDGFTATFNGDGTFNEKNVFDMTIIEGTYVLKPTIDPKNPTVIPTRNDSIRFYYKSQFTKKDTSSVAHIPYMFDSSFAFYNRYYGSAEGVTFRVEDIRYYRHRVRGPNYSNSKNPKFSNIQLDQLLGVWQFTDYTFRLGQLWYPAPPKIAAEIGQYYEFAMVNGNPIFREYLENDYPKVANRSGDFKIVDDVVHMRTWYPYNGGQIVENVTFESFQFWIQEISDKTGVELIADYNKYRDPENVLREKQVKGTYKRIK